MCIDEVDPVLLAVLHEACLEEGLDGSAALARTAAARAEIREKIGSALAAFAAGVRR